MKPLIYAGILTLAASSALSAVTIGQVDTFSDGTTMGWGVPGPSPNPPSNVPGGGPGGAGDAYLLLSANGTDSTGGRLSALNSAQWAGDYLAAGVNRILMDVNNFGTTDLDLRLLFEDFAGPPPPVNVALSAEAVHVPAGSGWMTIAFPIAPADLVSAGLGTVAGALASTDTLRIFHNPAAAFPGPGVGIPAIEANLGVDNIRATALVVDFVPEPGTASLFLGGAMMLGLVLARFKGLRG